MRPRGMRKNPSASPATVDSQRSIPLAAASHSASRAGDGVVFVEVFDPLVRLQEGIDGRRGSTRDARARPPPFRSWAPPRTQTPAAADAAGCYLHHSVLGTAAGFVVLAAMDLLSVGSVAGT